MFVRFSEAHPLHRSEKDPDCVALTLASCIDPGVLRIGNAFPSVHRASRNETCKFSYRSQPLVIRDVLRTVSRTSMTLFACLCVMFLCVRMGFNMLTDRFTDVTSYTTHRLSRFSFVYEE